MRIVQRKEAKASNLRKRGLSIRANEDEFIEEEVVEDGGEVEIAPEVEVEYVFEVQDVAELLQAASGQEVVIEAVEDDVLEITVGNETFEVEVDPDAEVVSSRQVKRNQKPATASRKRTRKPAQASRKPVERKTRELARVSGSK